MTRRNFVLFLLVVLFSFNAYSDNIVLGRVTFFSGDPVLINPAGQMIHVTGEMEFSNHSRFKLEDTDRIELFLPDKSVIKVYGSAQFLVRYVGNEVQIIMEYGKSWFKIIDRTILRWNNYQIVSEHGLYTAETLVNDMLKVSCIDGRVDVLKNIELKTSLSSTDRAFISLNDTIDEVSFGISSENIRWMSFKDVKNININTKNTQLSDSDFVLPPGAEEELLLYAPEEKKEKSTQTKISIDFISPKKNQVNIGKTLRVAGRVNTIMVKNIEVYVDDEFMGNIEVNNFSFDGKFNIKRPSNAKFLDCVAKDIYGNKAVFTVKLVPDTRPPVISVVPPFNSKKTQFVRGFVEDPSVNSVHISINKGSIYEENFDIPVKNSYFEFKISVDNNQTDCIPARFGSNYLEVSARDEFGNEGKVKNIFFLDQNLINNFFNK